MAEQPLPIGTRVKFEINGLTESTLRGTGRITSYRAGSGQVSSLYWVDLDSVKGQSPLSLPAEPSEVTPLSEAEAEHIDSLKREREERVALHEMPNNLPCTPPAPASGMLANGTRVDVNTVISRFGEAPLAVSGPAVIKTSFSTLSLRFYGVVMETEGKPEYVVAASEVNPLSPEAPLEA